MVTNTNGAPSLMGSDITAILCTDTRDENAMIGVKTVLCQSKYQLKCGAKFSSISNEKVE